MEPISADYMALRNAELSNQVQTAVMKKTMDAALEQSEQLLATLPKMPTEESSLDWFNYHSELTSDFRVSR